MKDKYRRFADEYLIDLNAEAAAIRAGYSPRYARGNAHKLVANSCIKKYIEERMAEKESELIADQDEVLRYLTSVLRGKSRSSVVVVENIGDCDLRGCLFDAIYQCPDNFRPRIYQNRNIFTNPLQECCYCLDSCL